MPGFNNTEINADLYPCHHYNKTAAEVPRLLNHLLMTRIKEGRPPVPKERITPAMELPESYIIATVHVALSRIADP